LAKESENEVSNSEKEKELLYYDENEVKEHNSIDKRIWVTFKDGVYDITEFVESHPGGNKILLAAGSSLEPFWEIYTVHKTDEVFKMLEEYRIGNLKESKDFKKEIPDAFQNDPKRHPLLQVISEKPFNAETPSKLASESIITPNELHFVRNHLPVPNIDIEKYELEIINEVTGKKVSLKLDDLKNHFPIYKIPGE